MSVYLQVSTSEDAPRAWQSVDGAMVLEVEVDVDVSGPARGEGSNSFFYLAGILSSGWT